MNLSNVQCWNYHYGVKEKGAKYEKTDTPTKSAENKKITWIKKYITKSRATLLVWR